MHMHPFVRAPFRFAVAALACGVAVRCAGQASPYRGLWVGTVSLRSVNEVAIPLDKDNVPIAPNPQVPTATYDEANVRLILHVNGAGQVSLLKDVAILNRVAAAADGEPDVFADETDLALVTDPRLYASYPPQPARRIASAVFDFGDAEATRALDALVAQATQAATTFAMTPGLNLGSQALRVQARQTASAGMLSGLTTTVENANVAESFRKFLEEFSTTKLNTIAADPASPVVGDLLTLAGQFRDKSFYRDERCLDMVNAVVAAVNAAAPADRQTVAHNTASAFADVGNLYQRFVSGKSFGDMLKAAAVEAGTAAKAPGATVGSVDAALRVVPESITALDDAQTAKVTMYDDTRSVAAIHRVLAAMAQAAIDHASLAASDIRSACEQAGRAALAEQVARYPLPVQTPTLDYNAFVLSAAFLATDQKVADAAARGAIDERGTNPLSTWTSVRNAARLAALKALEAEYGAAARALRTELPLTGVFGPGSGDPRSLGELAQPSDLGAPGLVGRITLPASHPTNPFRHRRHFDHTLGFDIERDLRLDFDGVVGEGAVTAAYGVDQVTGTYREEVFGLHKPLGPDPVNAPVGLRTEGRFQLNRISFIDTLNTL